MSMWSPLFKALAEMPGLTPAERAAADRVHAAAVEADVAVLQLEVAAHEAAGALRDFAATWIAGDEVLKLDEAEQVAQHPDLAELNVRLDGWYG